MLQKKPSLILALGTTIAAIFNTITFLSLASSGGDQPTFAIVGVVEVVMVSIAIGAWYDYLRKRAKLLK